ncbi:MAG: hypothetical protein JXA33_02660 [Anaerolineae bacterium]|nr:hypothetical protein [Anaerolineae bacterium]
MAFPKFVRESAFRLVRHDLALFLKKHEADLIRIFREEIQILDDALPEENLFIEIKMVPLGEIILKAALRAIGRFLTEDVASEVQPETGSTADK